MKTLSSILPWAIVVAGFGGAIWWLLAREMTAGRWLLAAFLVGHGAVHLLFAVPAHTMGDGADWPFDMGRSWMSTGLTLSTNTIRIAGWALIAVIVIGYLLAGLSAPGVGFTADWWPTIVVVPSIVSTVALLAFFTPQLLLGIGIDVVLVWLGLAGSWTP